MNGTGDRVVIRALKDLTGKEGAFVGLDGNEYELQEGDIATVPAGNAEALVDQNAAVIITPEKFEVVLPHIPKSSDEDEEERQAAELLIKQNNQMLIAQSVSKIVPVKNRSTGEIEWKTSIDNQKMVKYLKEKYSTISVSGSRGPVVWLYKYGFYQKDNGIIQSEITTVARCMEIQRQITVINEIRSMLEGTNFYERTPFNYEMGILPVKNGIIRINFDTGQIEGPFSPGPEYLLTYRLPIEYDPTAPTAPVLDVLKKWVPEEDVDILIQIPAQGFLQAWYDRILKKNYLLQGETNSGKSTYLSLFDEAFGMDTGVLSRVSLHSITENNFSLGDLENRIINYYDDLSSSELHNYGKFKNISGSTHHDIEVKHQSRYSGRIFCVHVFTCNIPPTVPEIVNREPAFWGRWEYVNFPNEFKVDPTWTIRTFTPKFMSGFLNLIIGSIIEIHKTGKLKVNRTGDQVREKWSLASDPLLQFLEDMSKESNQKKHWDKDKLFQYYGEWFKDSGQDPRRRITSIEKFSRDLQKYGIYPGYARVKTDERKSVRVACYDAMRTWNDGDAQLTPLRTDQKPEFFEKR